MQASNTPEAVAVEVIAAQPTEADSALTAQLAAEHDESLPPVTYIVRVKLETVPEATSQGWALYVGDVRIPKYWAYSQGIYFKVFDPQFFTDNRDGRLRFSRNGTEFTETGLKLTAPQAEDESARADAQLPRQDEVLQ
ncbi:MAG TPA: hypothetical protein VIW24_31125 [Aldersonia sp.]